MSVKFPQAMSRRNFVSYQWCAWKTSPAAPGRGECSQYLAHLDALLASRSTAAHTEDKEASLVEVLDGLWHGLTAEEQKEAEACIATRNSPGSAGTTRQPTETSPADAGTTACSTTEQPGDARTEEP